MPIDASRRYTLADLDAFPGDGQRYEIVDGMLCVTPLARRRHQWVVTQIAHRLKGWTELHSGAVYAGVNVDLANDTHLEPDVAYVGHRGHQRVGVHADGARAGRRGVLARDEVIRPGRQARPLRGCGCAEFWFVDLDDDIILQFVAAAGLRYGPPAVHGRGATFTSGLLPGLVLDVDDLLGPPEH